GEYGLPVDDALLARVDWWSARASFANVLWHLERRYEYGVFQDDALAALQREITPHQVFCEDAGSTRSCLPPSLPTCGQSVGVLTCFLACCRPRVAEGGSRIRS